MPSNLEIEITDGSLILDVEIGPPETIDVNLTQAIPTFNALTGPGLKGDKGEKGDRGLKGDTSYVIVVDVLEEELQNGVNFQFSLSEQAKSPTKIQVFRNGLLEIYGLGYTATTTQVTFTTPPLANDVVSVVYEKV